MKTITKDFQQKVSPEQALALLESGNKRFVNNLATRRDLLEQVNITSQGQYPFAIVLSCIDSRTSAELIFDQGLGDIFSTRIAGNVINTDILGSMEFATKAAGSKLILVLGHSKCGAIKGACDHVEMGNLTELLSKITPAVYSERSTLECRSSANPEFVENVAAINVKRMTRGVVERSAIIRELLTEQKVGVVGAMYDIDSGEVEFYPDATFFSFDDYQKASATSVTV